MNKYSVGNYINLVREYQGIKQEMLASDVNISRTLLSKIENGKEQGNELIIRSLFSQLGIDYEEYVANKDWMRDCLKKVYKSIMYGNQNYVSIVNEVVEKVEKNILLSFYTSYKFIMMLIAYKDGENDSFVKWLELLSQNEKQFDDFENAIYKDFLSIKLMEENNYEDSLNVLSSINTLNLPKYMCGMIEYHIGTVYHYVNNYYMSAKHLEKAVEFFAVSQNFNKIVYSQILIADAFFKTGNVKPAMDMLENTLEVAYNITNIEIATVILNNLAWYSALAGNYSKSIIWTEKALTHDQTRADFYFYLAFSYFRLNDQNKSMEYINMAENLCDTDSDDYQMCIALKKIIKNSKNRIAYLEKLYNSFDDFLCSDYKQLLLQFIIIEFEKKKDYEKLAEYSLKLNKKLSKIPLMFSR